MHDAGVHEGRDVTAAYEFKLRPFAHQLREFEQSRDAKTRALLWDMGTGKSGVVVNTAAWLFERGEVDCLFVVAPNGLHRMWVNDELPKHLPDRVAAVTQTLTWNVDHAKKSDYPAHVRAVRTSAKFLVVACSYHATTHRLGEEFCEKILKNRKCLLVLDECTEIKSPGAKWTKRITAFGRWVKYRRILTGTLVANDPFDVFCPIRFLDPGAWAHLGVRTSGAFKAYFGEFAPVLNRAGNPITTAKGVPVFDVVGYRNLPAMRAVLDAHGSRVTKEQCLDLPPKLYTKRYFELSPEQRRAYRALADQYEAEVRGGTVTATIAIVRLTRFQQITDGFVVDDDGREVSLCDPNPRIELLLDVVRGLAGSFIVWSKYRRAIDDVVAALDAAKVTTVRYDGQVSDDQREANKNAFQAREARAFVGNPAAGGMGLTLTAATTVIYLDNGYRLTSRLQSEDRAHRIGQAHPVLYVDIVAEGTVDEAIVQALREKREIAAEVTGDALRAWI